MLYFQGAVFALEAALLAVVAGLLWEAARGRAPVTPSPRRRRTGNAVLGLAIVIFFVSGFTKLAGFPPAVAEMKLLGLTGWKYDLVAGIELTSGLLLAAPDLRSLALLFVSA